MGTATHPGNDVASLRAILEAALQVADKIDFVIAAHVADAVARLDELDQSNAN
jgi:NAD(P)H-flavin reductase